MLLEEWMVLGLGFFFTLIVGECGYVLCDGLGG